MQLSPNFTLEEFTRNSRGFVNKPSPEVVERLRWLCVFVLEPLRAHFNCPIKITSGYRSPELNAIVGGEATSFHLADGDRAAADIQITLPLKDVFNWLNLESKLPYDQIILERGREERHEYEDCIHIQISANPRRLAKLGPTHGQGSYEDVTGKAI